MMEQFGYPEWSTGGEQVLTTREGIYRDMLMDIRVYRMAAGTRRVFRYADDEMAILLMSGTVKLGWQGQERTCARAGIFEELPWCLHVPRDVEVVVDADKDSGILVQLTANSGSFDAKLYTPEECRVNMSGEGLCGNTAVRQVRTIIDYSNAPYSNLVIGEVIGTQGGWASYIPHHHPQPEVYYYRFDRPEGFGACFIGDNAFKIKDESFCAIPGGLTHPQVSAPGFRMYTCWMIRHFEGNPWTDRIDDETYTWLLDAKF